MSQERIKTAIKDQKMRCPKCKGAVKSYEKYVDMIESVWDGFGDSRLDTKGSKVTLICGNGGCDWRERTEFWETYIE
ncbi:MAG TPA: hypothetical protein V6C72_06615 [Chroococcales cyanobacterium]